MKEYLPWSELTLNNELEKYKNGRLSILDIQLGGGCNYNCTYCDSPDRKRECITDLSYIRKLISLDADLIDWIFVCGLGEPLFETNKDKLLYLLDICREYGIKCSVFTNGSLVDSQICSYIENGILFPLIKVDSLSAEKVRQLYRTNNPSGNLHAISTLFDIAKKTETDYCLVGASIVPTRANIDEIPAIVERCISNNVFPLIAELECAGLSTGDHYESLYLSREELQELKNTIQIQIGEEYKIPICPSVISGIHITNEGIISVDEVSGLSCPWYWLLNPKTHNLCSIKDIHSFKDADKQIIDYRNSVYKELLPLAEKIEPYPFGGCGGNVRRLLFEYISIQKHIYR